MNPLLLIALRNIRRNKARSALTFGAIFFGVAVAIILSSLGNGLGVLMRDDAINAKVGAIQVHRKGYATVKDNQPLTYDIEQGGALEASMKAVHGVLAVAPRMSARATRPRARRN